MTTIGATVIRPELTTTDLSGALNDAVSGLDNEARHSFRCYLIGVLISDMHWAGLDAEFLHAVDMAAQYIVDASGGER